MPIQKLKALANKTDVYQVVEVAAPGFSDWYEMPQGMLITSVEVIPGAGATARVETTLEKTIKADGSVAGVVWPEGDVTTRTQDTLNGGALIRLVSVVL
ncbi:MAG: hypothetical protein KAR06_06030, partial [Deltaproteobacteria bacterium]|nr:hypothetical protein [Deltaproteobacteria bacterium]